MIIKHLLLLATAVLVFFDCAHSEELQVLESGGIKILYEAPLTRAAREVAEIYPHTRAALEENLGWELDFKPSVLLIRDRDRFTYMARSTLIVGFAVPDSNMIVIDYTRMTQDPFSIGNTLKHELCHLLLHHRIPGEILPKWLDEGVCQWVSDWVGDIIMDRKRSYLNRAAIRGSFLSLRSLHHGFPSDKEGMLLAYEQSKSVVDYIISQFGKEGILSVLDHMKKGEAAEQAFLKALSIPLEDLEIQWRRSVGTNLTWFAHLSYYLYEILFGLMALISIFAFIRLLQKKRAYMAEDPEDGLLS